MIRNTDSVLSYKHHNKKSYKHVTKIKYHDNISFSEILYLKQIGLSIYISFQKKKKELSLSSKYILVYSAVHHEKKN